MATKGRQNGYPVTKSREFVCPECGCRCTRGKTRDVEYGHPGGCPRRPESFPNAHKRMSSNRGGA